MDTVALIKDGCGLSSDSFKLCIVESKEAEAIPEHETVGVDVFFTRVCLWDRLQAWILVFNLSLFSLQISRSPIFSEIHNLVLETFHKRIFWRIKRLMLSEALLRFAAHLGVERQLVDARHVCEFSEWLVIEILFDSDHHAILHRIFGLVDMSCRFPERVISPLDLVSTDFGAVTSMTASRSSIPVFGTLSLTRRSLFILVILIKLLIEPSLKTRSFSRNVVPSVVAVTTLSTI